MSCEQEMCPFWDGEGCPCSLLGMEEEDREAVRERMGIFPEDPE